MERTCGSCTLCCKVLGVAEISKVQNVWCKHVGKDHKGCMIHDTKVIRLPGDPEYPLACKSFRCLWLEKQVEIPDWMRPDKVKAFLTATVEGDGIVVHVDPGYPQAHLKDPLRGVIEGYHAKGIKLLMMVNKRVWMMNMGRWYECVTEQKEGRVTAVLKGIGVPG